MRSIHAHAALAAVAALFLSVGATALRAADEAAPNTLTEQEKKAGFKLLFDGKNPGERFRSYKKDQIDPRWKAVDGALTKAEQGAGDIITKDQYEAFELLIDYRISRGGNSGIMFHVAETDGPPYVTGPEIQIQDNVDGHDPQKSGWLYQLYKPDTDATRPAGQWNTVRIVLTPKGQKSAVYMNGQKYYEFEKGSADWDAKVKQSKFKDMPGFGRQTKGHICLQDHGDEVAYRNIKIRVIDAGATAQAGK